MAQQDRVVGLIGSLGMKPPCRMATTADVTLSGLQTIDGVVQEDGDRVLVKNQTDPVENGIYYAGTSTWERAPDFDGTRDVFRGTSVAIAEGATHVGQIWYLSSSGTTIDTSELSFTQILGSGTSGLTASAFMQTVLDDTTAAIARTTLGAAALNGSSTENFSADSLSVTTAVELPGASKVNSSGYLGLGTVSPLSFLHVAETSTASTRHTSKIQRTTNHVGGTAGVVASALSVSTTVIAASTNYEYGIASYLDTYAASSYNIAGYFEANKRAVGSVEAGVFIAKDHTAVDNPTGAMHGITVGMYANGVDGFNTRIGIEILTSRVNTLGAMAAFHAGLKIGVLDADSSGSYYDAGISLTDSMVTAIKISNTGAYSSYGIWDTGNKTAGIFLNATYTRAAIVLNAGQKIAFEVTGTSTLRADAVYTDAVGFEGCWVNFQQGWGVTSGATNIASSASGGAASALPALPSGYLKFKIDGTAYKLPYYN